MTQKRAPGKKSSDQSSPIFSVTNLLLFGVILAGVGYLFIRDDEVDLPKTTATHIKAPTQTTPDPPKLQIETIDGVEVANIDESAFREWCQEAGLPTPPASSDLDPFVARKLWDVFVESARNPTAGNLGLAGQICLSLQAYESAEAFLSRAATQQPGEFRWQYLLGCIAQRLGQIQEAQTRFEKSRALNPDYPILYARYGQVLFDDGQPEAAERMYQKYNELEPDQVIGLVGTARIVLGDQRPESALSLLERAFQIAPNDFQVRHLMGETLVALGREREAEAHFDVAAKLPTGVPFNARDPIMQELNQLSGTVEVLVTELRAVQHTQDFARMAEIIEEIVERRPGDVVMSINLVEVYRKLGRIQDAYVLLDRIERKYGQLPRIHTTRAAIFLSQNNSRDAEAECRKAIALDPNDERAYDVLARALYLKADLKNAETAIRKSIELDDASVKKWFVLGEILVGQKKYAMARECYSRVLEAAPNHTDARGRIQSIDRLLTVDSSSQDK